MYCELALFVTLDLSLQLLAKNYSHVRVFNILVQLAFLDSKLVLPLAENLLAGGKYLPQRCRLALRKTHVVLP